MIKKLTIKNFQSHKNSELNFTNGINIITGASDNGKSAVIRALNWAINNEPRGFKFKSHFAKDKQETSVRVEFNDGQFIERARGDSGGSGYYLTPNHGKDDLLEALGTGVPQEIKDIIDIEDYNIQGQHDNYFLLQKTGGEIARLFNDEIIGFDINTVDKKIKTIISKTKDGITNANEEIDKLKVEIKRFDYLESMQKEVEKLEKYLKERDLLRQERKELLSIVISYNEIEKDIEQIDEWLQIKEDSKGLFKLVDEQNDDIRELEFLKSIVSDYDKLEQEIKDLDLEQEFKELIENIINEIQQVKKDIIEYEELIKDIEKVETIDNIIAYADAKIERINREIKEIGMCPYCGGKL